MNLFLIRHAECGHNVAQASYAFVPSSMAMD